MIWDIISFEDWDSRIDNSIVFHIRLFVSSDLLICEAKTGCAVKEYIEETGRHTIEIMLSIF